MYVCTSRNCPIVRLAGGLVSLEEVLRTFLFRFE